MSLARSTRRALAARLGADHTARFADALVPTVTDEDVAWAHVALAARAKGELRPTRAGVVPAHAAWSSTALVCSAFAPWRHDVEVRLEERRHIPHGGGTPNLDAVIEADGVLLGVESKLTEHLDPKPARPWRPAYRRPAMLAALDGGWAETFAVLLEGRWTPRHLDAAQLVKHALSLQAVPRSELLLVFWEPADADRHPEIHAHREEVAELLARVGPDAHPRLHAMGWPALWAAWEPEKPEHVAALRARYAVAI